ncbi:MAG: hypothetical protein FJY85_08080 [Deltaproteobacteria bacterium]|nr:hypothetical protein [Deltaproteobacteria bacterium]
MKKMFVMLLAVGVFALLAPPYVSAQFYGYYPLHLVGPLPKPAPPPPVSADAPRKSLYYRLSPDPILYWKWNQYNAFQDFLEFQRSPNYRESDLSYMLRTF